LAKLIKEKFEKFITVDGVNFMCSKGVCNIKTENGKLLYRDKAHFSKIGSLKFAKYIMVKISKYE